MNADKDIIAILGPTCCWKSEVGLRLAERFSGEVVSCDSMQVYRGLDIGTAKASAEERARVPHHLIDILDISQPYDANRFVAAAKHAIDGIRSRHHRAFLVGGTGLYTRALLYGFSLLPSDPEVFRRLDQEAATENGRGRLIAMLEEAAARHGTAVPDECRLNPRRLVRACEILTLTGTPPWLLKQKNDTPDPRSLQFCIVPPLPMVKERIFQRTFLMLEQGWIEEADKADKAGLLSTPTARQALGYPEIIRYLHGEGPASLELLAECLANKTVQYARRQLTWFKHQHPGAVMLCPSSPDHAADWLISHIEPML